MVCKKLTYGRLGLDEGKKEKRNWDLEPELLSHLLTCPLLVTYANLAELASPTPNW